MVGSNNFTHDIKAGLKGSSSKKALAHVLDCLSFPPAHLILHSVSESSLAKADMPNVIITIRSGRRKNRHVLQQSVFTAKIALLFLHDRHGHFRSIFAAARCVRFPRRQTSLRRRK